MKASSSASATIAATIAFSTKAAGPSLHSFSKMDSIAKPESRIRPVLRPLLIRSVARHILPCRYQETQSATVGLRSESPDLVDLREILCTGREKNISRKTLLVPTRQRKPQARHS